VRQQQDLAPHQTVGHPLLFFVNGVSLVFKPCLMHLVLINVCLLLSVLINVCLLLSVLINESLLPQERSGAADQRHYA